MSTSTTRVSAYGVCWRGAQLLLVHQVAPGPARNRWTLPGGGLHEVACHRRAALPPGITAWALLAATLDGSAADRA